MIETGIGWRTGDVPGVGHVVGHDGLIDNYSAVVHISSEHGRGIVVVAGTNEAALSDLGLRGLAGVFGAAWDKLGTEDVNVPVEALRGHLVAMFEGPPRIFDSAWVVAHLSPEFVSQLTEAGAVRLMNQSFATLPGGCSVGDVRPVGKHGQSRADVSCGATQIIVRMGATEPAAPFRVGAFQMHEDRRR